MTEHPKLLQVPADAVTDYFDQPPPPQLSTMKILNEMPQKSLKTLKMRFLMKSGLSQENEIEVKSRNRHLVTQVSERHSGNNAFSI